MLKFLPLTFLVIFLSNFMAHAEPWLSNRYAQNCAACHAPGRLNKPAAGRRCTLSCQGCHVNPAGGGLRNEYGKWNEERWLSSMQSKFFGTKFRPAPHNKQNYIPAEAKTNKAKSRSQEGRAPQGDDDDFDDQFAVDKYPWYDEVLYNNHNYTDWQRIVDDREWMKRIPDGDPYKTERSKEVFAGGDFRYMFGEKEVDTTSSGSTTTQKASINFPMSFDLGVRFRPVPEKFSLVFETRSGSAQINNSETDYLFENTKIRSAYLLVDDLWYNSFFQYGLFRPQFGHFTPDHTNLTTKITGLDQNAIFKAIGIGTAPNVPFATIYALTAPEGTIGNAADLKGKQNGFVVNLGLRGVTLGLSGMLSYWSTVESVAGTDLTRSMYSFSGGFVWKRLIFNGEAIRYEFQDSIASQKVLNAGNLYNIETKTQIWRENYFVFNYTVANTGIDRTAGSANESRMGFKGFLWPGSEYEILTISGKDSDSGTDAVPPVVAVDRQTSGFQAQLHFYF